MPRLLILCEYPTLLGGERSMLSTLPAVAAAGFGVQVAAPLAGALAEALRNCGVEHVPLTIEDSHGDRLPLAQFRPALATLMERSRPDIVHANSLSIARIAGPVAAHCHLTGLGHLRDIVKLSRQAIEDLNSHRALIAVSNATRDFHVAQGLNEQKCDVAYNGVDLGEFRPRQSNGYLHRELQLSPSARLVAVIGQLGLRKGTDVALTAAAQVATAASDVHWLIVGERTSTKDESRSFEADLHATANRAPLAGRVHFLGQRHDVRELLTECTLLVHAARQEPLGRVLLESAASGLPVVATDVGGTREIFPAESDGAVLVPAADADSLAHEIIELLRSNERRQSLAVAGRRRAERQFDVRQASERLIEIYHSVLT